MAAAYAARGGGRGGAGRVRRRRARARRTRGPAALPARRARRRAPGAGRGADAGAPSASACAARRRSTRRRRAARRRCTRATAPSASGSPPCCAISSRSPRWIRRWRPRSSGCATRGAAIEDVARDLGRYARGVRSDPARLAEIEERLFLLSRLTAANTAARSPIWPRGARRSPPSWPRSARYDEALAARQAAADQADARAAAAAAALSASRKRAAAQPGEARSPRPCASSGFASAAAARSQIEARELGRDGRRSRALPVRAQPGRASRARWRGSPRAASCRG